jgi:hypothetical protein
VCVLIWASRRGLRRQAVGTLITTRARSGASWARRGSVCSKVRRPHVRVGFRLQLPVTPLRPDSLPTSAWAAWDCGDTPLDSGCRPHRTRCYRTHPAAGVRSRTVPLRHRNGAGLYSSSSGLKQTVVRPRSWTNTPPDARKRMAPDRPFHDLPQGSMVSLAQ